MLPQFIKRCQRALCELLTHTTNEWEVHKKNIGQMDYLRIAVGCRLREMLPLLGGMHTRYVLLGVILVSMRNFWTK